LGKRSLERARRTEGPEDAVDLLLIQGLASDQGGVELRAPGVKASHRPEPDDYRMSEVRVSAKVRLVENLAVDALLALRAVDWIDREARYRRLGRSAGHRRQTNQSQG
jgi:hypothetical protein